MSIFIVAKLLILEFVSASNERFNFLFLFLTMMLEKANIVLAENILFLLTVFLILLRRLISLVKLFILMWKVNNSDFIYSILSILPKMSLIAAPGSIQSITSIKWRQKRTIATYNNDIFWCFIILRSFQCDGIIFIVVDSNSILTMLSSLILSFADVPLDYTVVSPTRRCGN